MGQHCKEVLAWRSESGTVNVLLSYNRVKEDVNMKKITTKKELAKFMNDQGWAQVEQGKKKNGYNIGLNVALELEMLKFARENNCIITPVGWAYYIKNYIESGRCPCDPARRICPCEQAKGELHELGHCLCTLFWRSYDTYQEQKYKEARND